MTAPLWEIQEMHVLYALLPLMAKLEREGPGNWRQHWTKEQSRVWARIRKIEQKLTP
jgi:hypothetical protein